MTTAMRRRTLTLALLVLGLALSAQAQTNVAGWVANAIRAAGVPIVGVSIGDATDRTTWKVQPSSLQSAAQPTIDSFDPDDPAYEQAELDAAVTHALDGERLSSAIVWVILKQMFPADTDAQTRTKFGVARTRIIDAYKSQSWKP